MSDIIAGDPAPTNPTSSRPARVYDTVYDAIAAFEWPGQHLLKYAEVRDELAQRVTAALFNANIGHDTIVCDDEGCAIPCTPGCAR
ncbi:hypothetical protein [Streptomyces goshikiensis]|uniref:hypothetical protein n=1 Tax=Streptomyces goshikiensis TaxID=1942 RepID=UPI003721357C